VSQKIESPNAAELQWLEQNLDRLREFATKPAGHRFTLVELDSSFRDWTASKPHEEDPNPMINAFGAAFGQYFVDHLSMVWSVVTDEHGTEMAVCAQPGDVLVFPPNFVAKRVVAKEVDFFETTFALMAADIEATRRKAQPKPWWRLW
jgi:hypothetical protein